MDRVKTPTQAARRGHGAVSRPAHTERSRVVASVNLAATERNVARVRAGCASEVWFCAVIKGDACGHGAAPVARAALVDGADRLAVATVHEAAELRAAAIIAPVLIVGPLSAGDGELAAAYDAEVAAASPDIALPQHGSTGRPLGAYDQADLDMDTLGVPSAEAAARLAAELQAAGARVRGVMAQLADQDALSDRAFAERRARFDEIAHSVRLAALDVLAHLVNSPVLLRDASPALDMVRVGDLIYGFDPSGADASRYGLAPTLTLRSRIVATRAVIRGQAVGYGGQGVVARDTRMAIVSVGYGDGIRRATRGAQVIIAGIRRPVVGAMAMNSMVVDLGPDGPGHVDDPVTLIGADGPEHITAEELGRWMGAVNAEVACGLTCRVARGYQHDGRPSGAHGR